MRDVHRSYSQLLLLLLLLEHVQSTT